MTTTLNRPAVALTTAAAALAISVADAKKHLEIAASITDHDSYLQDYLIPSATEQFEHDTQICCINQTWTHTISAFEDCIYLTKRPVSSITSVKYYDSSNVQQTLSSTYYSLNIPHRVVSLAYNQTWPTTLDRWDAVEVKYVAGQGSASSSVNAMHKQAILLLIGYQFENRDMLNNDLIYTRKAYEELILKIMRASYP